MAGAKQQIHEILYIDENFTNMFGPLESADSPLSGDASQALVSQSTVAELLVDTTSTDVYKSPDIRPHLRDLKTNR